MTVERRKACSNRADGGSLLLKGAFLCFPYTHRSASPR